MISKINVSFDVPITSLGDLITAVVELGGIRVQDITMRDKPVREIDAVAEILHAPVKKIRGPYKPESKPRAKRKDAYCSFQLGDVKPMHVSGKGLSLRNTRYAKLSDLQKAKSLLEIRWHQDEIDTIICPSRINGVKDFLEHHRWQHVRGTPSKIEQLKYLALYESSTGGGKGAIIGVAPILNITRA